uniref:Uncharacterized protein n=1 Tax=Panagrolaimus sp. JU765 TaxID=591449 RepID=A0AC34RN74_9BILA
MIKLNLFFIVILFISLPLRFTLYIIFSWTTSKMRAIDFALLQYLKLCKFFFWRFTKSCKYFVRFFKNDSDFLSDFSFLLSFLNRVSPSKTRIISKNVTTEDFQFYCFCHVSIRQNQFKKSCFNICAFFETIKSGFLLFFLIFDFLVNFSKTVKLMPDFFLFFRL